MEHTPEHDVTAERPDSPVHLAGTDHMTVMGGDAASTVAFYRDLLGMPLVLEQPNLDAPEMTHLFFDTGDGRILTFFVSEDRPTRPHRGPGNVHHLAFSIAPGEFDDTKAALEEARWWTLPGPRWGRVGRSSPTKNVKIRPSPVSKNRWVSSGASRFGCSSTSGIPSRSR